MTDLRAVNVDTLVRQQLTDQTMIIDCFAGGGGASTGIELALGRSPDVAINHNAAALALHAANHPQTRHIDSNIWDVSPEAVTQGRKIGLLWASPDCKHFSKAKGAAVRDRNIRDLAWVVHRWARLPRAQRPDVILLENVEEFITWGPVGEDGKPIKEFAGQTFDLWVSQLRAMGYKVEWRELRACDYGAPTIRKRLFIVARCDGRRIVWPKPTHGNPTSDAVRKGKLLPWRTAAECIDWSLPCPSIFDTKAEILAKHGLQSVRPLADKTLARVARGMKRYVIDAEKPFLVQVGYGERAGQKPRVMDMDAPVGTVVAGSAKHALVAPYLATMRNSQKPWQGADQPTHTITAGGAGLTLIAPVITYAQQGGGNRTVTAPHHTICASRKDQNSLFGAFLAQHNGGPNMGAHAGHDLRRPISTIAATGSHQMPIAAFFAKYYGTGDGARHDDPMHTITTKDRFAHAQAQLAAPPFGPQHHARARQVADFLRAHGAWHNGEIVTLSINGTDYVVVDIGMRMLTPRELFRAQGFPEDYVIEGVWDSPEGQEPSFRAFPSHVQISCCGNSVCPPLAAALARANCDHITTEYRSCNAAC